jgi:hypothetical protein
MLLFYLARKGTLVIADEAQFALGTFESETSKAEIDRFTRALRATTKIPAPLKLTWLQSLKTLSSIESQEHLRTADLDFPDGLNNYSAAIQDCGMGKYGDRFNYLGYLLSNFKWTRSDERWLDSLGTLKVLMRPFLNLNLLILSAHITKPFIEHRLRMNSVTQLMPGVKISAHPKTKVYNLKCKSGTIRSIIPNNIGRSSNDYLMPLIASMILKNLKLGKSTLLVSKERFKKDCASRLRLLLNGIGQEVEFVIDGYQDADLREPKLSRIPIIHYGLWGINTFTKYESCYCMNSYYMSDREILKKFYDGRPEERVPEITMEWDEGKNRVWPECDELLGGRRQMLDTYAAVYEKGSVMQAIGRVRPYEFEREIFLFEGHDFSDEFPENYTELFEVKEVYQKLGLQRLREIYQRAEVKQLKDLLSSGLNLTNAAKEMGFSTAKASQIRTWAKKEGFYDEI